MRYFYIIYVLIFISFVSCSKTTKSIYETYSNKSCYHLKDISLNLDSLIIDGERLSMEGQFFILRDTLFWGDYVTGEVSSFNEEGDFEGYKIRRGVGPNEISGLNTISVFKDGCMIEDGSWNIIVYNKDWEIINKSRLDWNAISSIEQLRRNPNPELTEVYELEYYKNLIRPFGDDKAIIHITSEHPDFNAFQGKGVKKFYETAYSLGIVSLKDGRVEKMLAKYPPLYQQYEYLSTFKNQLFDTYNNFLFYSFEADSLIYAYDLEKEEFYSFGYKGKNMITNYPQYKSVEDMDAKYAEDRENYGYYLYLKITDNGKRIFRGYRKGPKSQSDGLQIYENNCLIADVEVPRDFEVVGFIHPWYYAAGAADVDNEIIKVYRFRIDE